MVSECNRQAGVCHMRGVRKASDMCRMGMMW